MGGSRRPRVLLLDAHLRHAVAIVRSLGSKGIDVVCASPYRWFPARTSRFAAGAALFDPERDGAVEQLLAIVERERIDVVIPAALPGNELICRHRVALEPHVRAPYNDLETFEKLANKHRSTELAEEIGVPCPRTIELARRADVEPGRR